MKTTYEMAARTMDLARQSVYFSARVSAKMSSSDATVLASMETEKALKSCGWTVEEFKSVRS